MSVGLVIFKGVFRRYHCAISSQYVVVMRVLCVDVCCSLGKTIQVIGFLSGLFDAAKIKTVLIVAPVGVIVNWITEFERW